MLKILDIKNLRSIFIFNKFEFKIDALNLNHFFLLCNCTKMDQMNQIDQIGPNKIKMYQNRTEVDRIGRIRPKWT